MAISLNDILQIGVVQSYLGTIMNNIYYYRVASVTGSPAYDDVTDAFALTVLDAQNGLQNVNVLNQELNVKNLTNGIDIYQVANTATGDIAGEGLPTFVAWGFRLLRTTAITRHGSKRIGGISEGSTANNSPSAGILPAIALMEDELEADIAVTGVGGSATLEPVIVGRFPTGNPNAGELDLSVINPVATAQFIRITSQTTRRLGRGI